MLKGIAASSGAAVAQLFHLEEPDLSVVKESGLDPAQQHQRYDQAAAQAIRELDGLYEKARATDENVAQVFDIHRMMLEDPDLIDGIDGLLDEGYNAEYAVRETADSLAEMFRAMDDEYMQARAADVMDVGNRLIRVLKGIPDAADFPDEPVIVAAVDLLPSQTVRLDKDHVAGFVTKLGSSTSHSVILARTLGIPCIVGMGDDYDKLPQSGLLAIDGSTGEVVPQPDEATRAEFARRRDAFLADQAALEAYKDRKAVTKSGHKVLVCANIGGLKDIDAVIARGGGGVGLFRSEFIYLDSEDFPTEEAQFEIYKEVLSRLAPRPVVVRTLDLGSDKQAPYFGIEGEENPAMGYRAIRICLKQPEIFRTQLRALLRASVYGKLDIMFPMITGDRDPRRRNHGRRAGQGGGLLLHRHQRPDPVHPGRRPDERQYQQPVRLRPPRHPAPHRAHRQGRPRRGHLGGHLRRVRRQHRPHRLLHERGHRRAVRLRRLYPRRQAGGHRVRLSRMR